MKAVSKTTQNLSLFACMALTAFSLGHSARAQTANWGGGGGDGLWNTAANWDIGVPALEWVIHRFFSELFNCHEVLLDFE